ncbi:MAG: hypothetical protein DWQ19_11445 [Crenarchaeota archaeon]|nr:MAG: hypothetical protein DWQ19_11445 [Thermoproteota archaeon]
MGKGDSPRPLSITPDEWARNWNKIFKDTSKKKKVRQPKRKSDEMSKIIDFYDDIGKDSSGRAFVDVVSFGFDEMEACHDYIQWLFPLREPSQFNPEAPLLTDEDIKRFKVGFKEYLDRAPNFEGAVDMFLSFLGFEWVWSKGKNYFKLSPNWEERKYTWAEELNHNHLRITRFLSCLTLLGWRAVAEDLLDFIKETAEQKGFVLNSKSVEYWEGALDVE